MSYKDKQQSRKVRNWISNGRPMAKEDRKAFNGYAEKHPNFPFKQLHKRIEE